MTDLYTVSTENVSTTNFCGGPCSDGCVDVGAIPGTTDGYVVRDSKPQGSGKELRFTTAELDDFARGWLASRGLAV